MTPLEPALDKFPPPAPRWAWRGPAGSRRRQVAAPRQAAQPPNTPQGLAQPHLPSPKRREAELWCSVNWYGHCGTACFAVLLWDTGLSVSPQGKCDQRQGALADRGPCPHPIQSYPILHPLVRAPASPHILSYPILSYPILSYPILFYPVLFYPSLSYPSLA
jgi:hypothetical protein